MRSFPGLFLIFFLVFMLVLTIGTSKSIKNIVTKKYQKIALLILLFETSLLILAFIYLYVYPNNAAKANNYVPYLYYNSILIIDIIFKLPLAISFVVYQLFSRWKQVVSYMGLIISINLIIGLSYGIVFGKSEIKLNTINLDFEALPKSFDGFRIIHISDIHLGNLLYNNELLKKSEQIISKTTPDVILFTGDLVNNFSYELKGWEDVFNRINSNTRAYSILGNHDYGDYTSWETEELRSDNFKKIVDGHEKFGFQLLRNEHTIFRKDNDSLYIIGVENWGHAPFPQYADLDSAMHHIPDKAFKIVLSHDPAHWESVIKNDKNIQLTLSGHTHGMQWGLKTAGIPFSVAHLTRINWGGLYKSENNFLYVNTGFGTVGFPWRIDMPAEITLITLQTVKID